jgi:hypothetical protein
MLRVRGAYIPMGAIYHTAAPFTTDDTHRYHPILLFWERAPWEDGNIVCSQDWNRGNPPYWRGKLEEDRVPKLLDSLEALGAFSSPVRNWEKLSFESAQFVIAIAAGSRRLFMQSEERVPVPPEQGGSELDLQFCKLWCELDSALMSLRPHTGKQLSDVQFEIDWLP